MFLDHLLPIHPFLYLPPISAYYPLCLPSLLYFLFSFVSKLCLHSNTDRIPATDGSPRQSPSVSRPSPHNSQIRPQGNASYMHSAGSRFNYRLEYRLDSNCSWFFSVTPGNCFHNALNLTTTSPSLNIHNTLSVNNPITQCY